MSGPAKLTRRAFGAVSAACLSTAICQEPFKIVDNVDLILLDVSVRDRNGKYVIDLPKQAFTVLVDGNRQALTHFARTDAPVTIGLVVDNSGSMRNKRPEVVLAGLAFAKESNSRDEFFVVNFNNSVSLGLPAGVAFTDSIQTLHSGLYMGQSGGQTALYDAIAYGINHLERGHLEKRTLVIVSDGGDNVSQLSESNILSLIEQSRATIYAIGLVDPEDRDLRPAILKKFASVSGGQYFQPVKLDDVIDVLHRIATDIRNRYTIGFSPSGTIPARKVHSIRINAASEGRKFVVHTRTSYTTELPTKLPETALPDWR